MHSSRLETGREQLWLQRLTTKIRSADGGGTKDEAGKIVISIEQVRIGRLCLNEGTSMSYMQWWDEGK